MEQMTGSTLGKEYVKAVYCHSAYMLGWMSHKLKSRLPVNINNLRYADDTTLMAESKEELKSILMKMKEESEKTDLKFNIQTTKIMISSPTLQGRQKGKKWKQ